MGLADRTLPVVSDTALSSKRFEAPSSSPGWDHDEAAWDKVRAIALDRLDQIMRLESKVLRGDKPRAIHDFRVASRRFQQALDLFFPPDPPRGILRLRRGIARSRKALSEVRNYDVFVRRVNKILARKRPPSREAWEAVRDYLSKQRAAMHSDAAAKVGKLNLSHIYVRLRAALEPDASFGGPNHNTEASHESFTPGNAKFQARLTQDLQRAWDNFEKASSRVQDSSDASVIHSARVAAKKLRYLIEIVHEFEKPLSEKALDFLRKVQRQLGDWHDLEVEEQILATMIARRKFLRKNPRLASDILKLMVQSGKARERLLAKHSTALHPGANEQLKNCITSLLNIPKEAEERTR